MFSGVHGCKTTRRRPLGPVEKLENVSVVNLVIECCSVLPCKIVLETSETPEPDEKVLLKIIGPSFLKSFRFAAADYPRLQENKLFTFEFT